MTYIFCNMKTIFFLSLFPLLLWCLMGISYWFLYAKCVSIAALNNKKRKKQSGEKNSSGLWTNIEIENRFVVWCHFECSFQWCTIFSRWKNGDKKVLVENWISCQTYICSHWNIYPLSMLWVLPKSVWKTLDENQLGFFFLSEHEMGKSREYHV